MNWEKSSRRTALPPTGFFEYLYPMKIVRLSNRDELLELFKREIKEIRQQKPEGLMHIALAGGRSMGAAVGAILAQDPDTRNRMRFYLVDERLKGDKNKDTLLNEGLTDPIAIPELGKPLSKEPFDLVFLGIGEDGHFASLFPGTYTEDKTEEQVLLVEDSPKPPKRRTTLSYRGFRTLATSKVFLLFLGEGKREALSRVLSGESPETLPVSFFVTESFDSTIITDLKE